MLLLEPFKNLVTTSRRIIISREDSGVGSRIGGSAPEGVAPPFINSSTQYFATVAFDDSTSQELSLFVSIDWDDRTCSQSADSLWKNVSKLKTSDCPLVQSVVHPSAMRSSSTRLASELPGRALSIEEETTDIVVEPGGELLLPSKIGGRPYFYYGTLSYIESVQHLLDQGFILFLQFTWGGYERTVPFVWPFGEYTFHLLAKETSRGIIWYYGWG
jgi:hypothetical protein